MRFLRLLALTALFPSLAAAAQQAPNVQQAAPAQPSGPTLQTPSTQQPTAANTGNTLSVNAQLVVVPTVVRDKHGALINDLTKDDFALQVGKAPQSIRYFDHDVDVPLTLGLLIDTSRSQTSVLDSERSASSAFLDKMLTPESAGRPADKGFIVQFAHQVELLQDVTDSRPKLQAALKQVGTESPSFQPSADSDTSNTAAHGGTALYDSVFLAADEVTAKQKGRRALILLTDGVDRNSKERLGDAIEAAQRADTIIYAIYFKGEQHYDNQNPNHRHHDPNDPNDPNNPNNGNPGGYPGGGYPGGGYPGGGYPGGGYPGGNRPSNNPGGHTGTYDNHVDGLKILEQMCGETGGRVFQVSHKDSVDVIYAEIGEELRSQYRLGFTPSAEGAKDGYHVLNLTLTNPKNKTDTIQTRDGYYTGN